MTSLKTIWTLNFRVSIEHYNQVPQLFSHENTLKECKKFESQTSTW